MNQLFFEEIIPPISSAEGAIVLLFEGKDPGQRIIVGFQGVLGKDRHPITIQLPDWCRWSPQHVSSLDGGLYKWALQPAQEPYSILWPGDVPRAEYKIGSPLVRVYFGEEPPALTGTLKLNRS
ncbi:hypothetical protein [Pseudomonas mosselii]|uniref:hypothetical protein n=1 Tax=Pseudomonas mosselii TaxID=78327 RepID=UPI003F38ADBF